MDLNPIVLPLVVILLVVGFVAYAAWLDYRFASPYERWKRRLPDDPDDPDDDS